MKLCTSAKPQNSTSFTEFSHCRDIERTLKVLFWPQFTNTTQVCQMNLLNTLQSMSTYPPEKFYTIIQKLNHPRVTQIICSLCSGNVNQQMQVVTEVLT